MRIMKPLKNILFDLDGTLSDPVEGITRSIRYSLEQLKLPCPTTVELAAYIGPPLRQTFAALCMSEESALVEQAVALFRERFSTVGLYENRVYDGVPEMLAGLRSLSLNLFVATSKPEVYARKILEHFSLDSYFVEVHGNELSGRLDDKADLLTELMGIHKLAPDETMMVGDRRHDVLAAKACGLSSLAVRYGYGSLEELEEAGADYICGSPREVLEYVVDACR
jgi:phosphoglycolate phosphatase